MPAQLLTLRELAARLPDTSLMQRFNKMFLAQTIRDKQDAITQYLGYDPVLDIRYGEGTIELVTEGQYVGNYRVETPTWPLLNDSPTAIFQDFFFTYPNTYLPSLGVTTDRFDAALETGEVYIPLVLASGAYLGGDISTVTAVGWKGHYVAGYGTGHNEPTPSGGGTGFSATLTVSGGQIIGYSNLVGGSGFRNPPVLVITGTGSSGAVTPVMSADGSSVASLQIFQPGLNYVGTTTVAVSSAPAFNSFPAPLSLKRALALLVREQLQSDDPTNQINSLPNPTGTGGISSLRTRTQSIGFRAVATPQKGANAPLGLGTPLSAEAMNILTRLFKKRFVFIM